MGWIDPAEDPGSRQCRLLNVSSGGLGFQTDAAVAAGQECRLSVNLHFLNLEPAVVKARIRWVRSDGSAYTVGAEILESSHCWLGPDLEALGESRG
jgi:hypothetical protein